MHQNMEGVSAGLVASCIHMHQVTVSVPHRDILVRWCLWPAIPHPLCLPLVGCTPPPPSTHIIILLYSRAHAHAHIYTHAHTHIHTRTHTHTHTHTHIPIGSSDGTIKVWDCEKQYCTHNLHGSKGIVTLLCFHPSSRKLTLFSSSVDCAVRVWDLLTSRYRSPRMSYI